MNTGRIWKIGAGLLVLFVLGGVCGATLGKQRGGWSQVKPEQVTDVWAERWYAQMRAQLELREDQDAKLRPMVAQLQRQLQVLQEETTVRTRKIVKQNATQMWDVLDDAQRARYRGLEQKNKLRSLVPASQSR